MRLPTEESRLEQTLHIRRLHGPVGDTAGGGRYLDQRLEPQKPSRSVADQLDVDAPAFGLHEDGSSGFIGAHAARGGVARHINPGRAHVSPSVLRALVINSSKRCGDTRPCNRSSIMIDGPSAQFPRQYTGSSRMAPSGVVP